MRAAFLKLVLVVSIVASPVSGATGDLVPLDGTLVFSDSHQPVAGAEVKLVLRGYFRGEKPLSWSARADGSGRYHFPELPARRTFAISIQGAALPLFQPVDLVATGHMPRHLPPLSVPPGDCSLGTVLDEAGRPLAGVAVRLFVRRNDRPPDALYGYPDANFVSVYETASDLDGRFAVWRPATDPEGIIKVEKEGQAIALEVLRASRKEPLRIQMQKGADISGKVLDELGSPVSDAQVEALPRISSSGEWIHLLAGKALSGPDGRFVIRGLLPSEPYNVVSPGAQRGFVSSAGEAADNVIVVPLPDRDKDDDENIEAELRASFSGKVRSAATGKPIEGVQIELWPAGHGKHAEHGSATDSEGYFEVPRLTQESEYLVTVRAPNHAPLFDDVRVALAHHEKNYQLVEIEPAISSCRDLGGSPLPNIPIACFVGSSDLSHLYSRGITDRDGRCILSEATVDAVARWTNLFDRNQGWSIGLKPVSITGGVAMFDVPAESLRGEVRDQAGKPVVGASVRIEAGYVFTDSLGKFSLTDVSTSLEEIEIRARGKLPRVKPLRHGKIEEEPFLLTMEADKTHEIQVVDDAGQPVSGIINQDEVSESHGFLYVPAGDSLRIYLPFYKDVSLWEPSPLETSADRPHFKRGAQRVVLERAGGISLKLSKEQFARLWSHDGPEIGVEDSTGKTLGHLDYSVRYLEKSSEVYINRIPPGRYRILLKRFGPYQPLSLPDIEVRALERTHLDNLRLEEGATLLVESAEMMADFKAHNINCVIDGARFVQNDAKEVREAILGSFTKTGLHFQGIPPSSGTLEIDMLKTYYPFHASVEGLKPQETRVLRPPLERLPSIQGLLSFAGKKEPTGAKVWLRFTPTESENAAANVQSARAEDVQAGPDGAFQVFLKDGEYRMSLMEAPEDSSLLLGITPSENWRIVRPEILKVVRGHNVKGLQVDVEGRAR